MKQLYLFITLSFCFISALATAQDSSGGDGGGGNRSSYDSGASSSAGRSGVGIVVGENYVLKPSDVISVSVYQESDLDKSVRIEGDGSVALALIGKVKLAGMTVAEAQSLVTDLYNRDYLVDPQVSLLVVEFSPKIVHILGSVNGPGQVAIPPDRDLTLTEAIAAVGGVSRIGNPKSITIKRIDEDGRARQMEVNFTRIIQDPNAKDIILQEGDTIWVPERII
ncbi:polysaccharide biosynthesis/export family protein [Coraliomargarita algicola]|uniref:Polysaccharide biosynthesis/export family protein n=1 Tax=Coraliomargarita algicola TaxID=3092156 RepID=A0ABZ0RHT5_9BACT|nr:polysaccharide biosynthesis/export family protein [Coraliomargarita sp. J2-16]WPJ95028.1 polysaccharide biosynthesis/export family protein [Coraliomargarita sp. J2-16]